MKFDALRMGGVATHSAADRAAVMRCDMARRTRLLSMAAVLMLVAGPIAAESLYKYRGENGEWIFSDRPPDDGEVAEIRDLGSGQGSTEVTVSHRFEAGGAQLVAHNRFHAPIEIALIIETIRGIADPGPDKELRWVLPPRSETPLANLTLLDEGSAPFLEYKFRYRAGDPQAEHRPPGAYRVPFSIAANFPITQAYPDVKTHTTPDSFFAVDVAMPVGTDIFAARSGVVFDVAGDHYRSGLDPAIDGPAANVVRILHDDGTYAIYAHLNWHSIRVRPGDVVRRGEYIADSGNTGFSSGPHLHFAVVRNVGLQTQSVPIVFTGADANPITPATGLALTAY